MRAEILYLAAKGHITLALDSEGHQTITRVEVVDSNPIDHSLTQALFDAIRTKDERLTNSDIDEALFPIVSSLRVMTLTRLYEKELIRSTSPSFSSLSWVWLIFSPGYFAFVEFSFASRSSLQPLLFGVILILLIFFLMYPFSSATHNWRIPAQRWFVFPWMLVHVGIAFGIYWTVSCGWDQVVMCAWAALASELQVWVMIAKTNWTLRGAKEAREGLLYLRKLSEIEPGEGEQALFLHTAYTGILKFGAPRSAKRNFKSPWLMWSTMPLLGAVGSGGLVGFNGGGGCGGFGGGGGGGGFDGGGGAW
jgi:uncharacterized membrane protein YgcG